MADLIDRQAAHNMMVHLKRYAWTSPVSTEHHVTVDADDVNFGLDKLPAVDAVEVVRCQNCIHSEPLERNCELNTTVYMHCKIGRGEETLNVWHKYKKYYKDYSVVDRDGYCDEGERRGEDD